MARSQYDTGGLDLNVWVTTPDGRGCVKAITEATRLPVSSGWVEVLVAGSHRTYRVDAIEIAEAL